VNEVLAHLRSCADVWGGCIATMLAAAESPTIRAGSPPTWLTQTDYLELEFQPSFRAYADQRHGLIETLQTLEPDEWLRSATVVGAGRPVQRSVHTYTEWIAIHERAHIKQIRRIAQATRELGNAQTESPGARHMDGSR